MKYSFKFLLIIAILFFNEKALQAQDFTDLKNAKAVTLSGSLQIRNVNINSSRYQIPKINTDAKNVLLLGGDLNVNIYGIDVPLSFIFSNGEKSFNQPFNQYGASPKYKWLTIHAGYRNLNYNQFTLAGYTMLGGGFDATPGKWRIGAMYGRLARATTIDTISGTLQPFSFTRKGLAAKIGYGSDNNFFEISAIKANDDANSVDFNIDAVNKRYNNNITPAENLATGFKSKITIVKKLFVETELGLSIYTRDVNNKTDLGMINSQALINSIKKLVLINATTEYYKAIQAAIGYQEKNWTLKLKYIRIDPEYKSMGAYFLNSDVQNITIAPTVRFLKNKLNIGSSIGIQNDNLNGNKRTTAHRTIGSLNINAQVNKHFNISSNFSNYSVNQTPNITRLADTLRITQTTQNISVTPMYYFTTKNIQHTIVFTANYNKLNDYNDSYAANQYSRDINATTAFLNYNLNYLPHQIGVTVGLNYSNIMGTAIADDNKGATLGLNKSFFKNKLQLRTAATYLNGKRNNQLTTSVNGNAMLNYKISRMQQLQLLAFYNSTTFNDILLSNKNFHELRNEVVYTLSF